VFCHRPLKIAILAIVAAVKHERDYTIKKVENSNTELQIAWRLVPMQQ
jgi:hypothetical protein